VLVVPMNFHQFGNYIMQLHERPPFR
jgi:hypothetical protein